MNVNLGLSKKDFETLVRELQNGNEELFEIVFKQFVNNGIKKLKKKYRNDNKTIEDAVMETLITFRLRLINGKIKYGALDVLFYKLLFQEYARIKGRDNKYIYFDNNDEMGIPLKTEFDPFDKEVYYFLDIAFNKLNKKCIEVLKGFYLKNLSINTISEEMNLSSVILRKRKQRCLEKLKEILSKIGDFT